MGIVVGSALVLLVLGVPIAFGMILATVPGFLTLDLPLYLLPQRILLQLSTPTFLAIPFFILAGELMVETGVARRLIDAARSLIAHRRGGLAQSSIVVSVGFSGISGSAVADAAFESSIFIPMMKRDGYRPAFAAAVISAGAALGPIIPPSIVLIIYAAMTGLSVGALFLGGIIPGALVAAAYMTTVALTSKRAGMERKPWVGWRATLTAMRSALWAILAPVIIVGGIVGGVVTATEAGAVAVLYVLIVGLFSRSLPWKRFVAALERAAISSAAVVLIVGAANVLAFLLGFTGVPGRLGNFMGGIGSAVIVTLLSAIIILLLGTVMDSLSAGLLLIPVLHPIAVGLGIDPIYFAVVLALSIVAGGMTPPVGLYLFITSAAADVSVSAVSRAILPFLTAFLIVLAACLALPGLITWLPHTVLG